VVFYSLLQGTTGHCSANPVVLFVFAGKKGRSSNVENRFAPVFHEADACAGGGFSILN
jgi:hypothetical protein